MLVDLILNLNPRTQKLSVHNRRKRMNMSSINSTGGNSTPVAVATQTQSTSSDQGLHETELRETEQVQLTEYHDAAQSIDAAVVSTMPDQIWQGTQTLPNQALKDVLSRSYQLGVITWTGSAVGTDLIAAMDVMQTLLAIPNIAEKVLYFKYFRCKGVRLTIRVNSTSWHYGCLVASSTVNDSHQFHNNGVITGRQYCNNRPVLLDATSMDAVNYDIPWSHNEQWVDVVHPADHLMTFRLTVGVGLSMIGSVLNDAKVTLFANFIEPEVSLPVGDSVSAIAMKAQSGRKVKSKEAAQKTASGSFASGVHDFADTLFEVVDLGTSVAERLAPLAAMVADKPTSLSAPQHMVVLPGTNMMQTRGLDTTVKMCADPEANAGVSSGSMGDAIGNPSVYDLVKTPGFLGDFAYNSGTAAGAKVWSHALSLKGMSFNTGILTTTPTPLNWFAPMFKFWRGGLKFYFHFVTSSFVTSRLRIVWIPPDYAVPTTLADNESGDYVSQVLEVTGTMDHCLTIPWISRKLYRKVCPDDTVIQAFSNESNSEAFGLGSIAIYLITPIVTIDSVITPTITSMIWVSGAEDMQFSNFAGSLGVDPTLVRAYAPAEEMQAQCSVMEVFESPFDPIIAATTTVESGLATSEDYGDLVSLGKRYSVTSAGPDVVNQFWYDNAFVWSEFLLQIETPRMFRFQQWLTACHVNFRGSVRFKVFWVTDNATITHDSLPMVIGAYDAPAAGIVNHDLVANPHFVTSNFNSNHFMEFETTWNTDVLYMHRGVTSDDDGLNARVQVPVTTGTPLAHTIQVAMALGDDFAIGVYEAPPLIEFSSAPPAEGLAPSVKHHINQ